MDPAGNRRGAHLTEEARGSVSGVEAEYFDRLVRVKGEFDPFAPRGWRTIAARFSEMVGTGRVRRFLDIGCGTGQSHQVYADRAAGYVGIDLSLHELSLARKKGLAGGWVCADACRLPFGDASFDAVAFSSVLHHIPDFAPALSEARRVLAPGGSAFAFDPNLLHPAMALLRWPKSPFYIAEGVSPNEAPLLASTLRRAFQGAGFVEIRQRCQSGIAYREVAPRLINACLSLYNAADWAFERIGLGRWFGTFVLTAGRKPAAPGR
ncbi:MAG: class I SAM-dependent methyltransferase [Acidobacteriota bacterium]